MIVPLVPDTVGICRQHPNMSLGDAPALSLWSSAERSPAEVARGGPSHSPGRLPHPHKLCSPRRAAFKVPQASPAFPKGQGGDQAAQAVHSTQQVKVMAGNCTAMQDPQPRS